MLDGLSVVVGGYGIDRDRYRFVRRVVSRLLYDLFFSGLGIERKFRSVTKGRQMRNVLIGVQYVASFGLIIGAVFMYLQNYYMQHAPLGYDKDEIIVTDLNAKLWKSHEAFVSQVKSFSGID